MHTPSLGFIVRRETPPEEIQGIARRAESAGYDELWVVEDCFFAGGIASSATALAATTTLHVGLGIAPAVARNPAFLAMEIATLARMHPGRFLPGVGHGVAEWMRQIGALPASQLTALEENIVAIRTLLRGELYNVKGQYVSLENVQLEYPPAQVPPLAVGVQGPRSLRLAGRVGDGTILTEGSPPAYVTWAKEQIAQGISKAGRKEITEHHRITVFAWCCVDDDSATAHKALRAEIAARLAVDGLHAQIAPLNIATEVADLVKRGGVQLLQDEMPDAWLDQLAIVGNPAECIHAITQLARAGADAIILFPPADQATQQLDAFAHHVLPHLS